MSTNQSGKIVMAIAFVVIIAAAGYSFIILSEDSGNTTKPPTTIPTIPEILPLNQPIAIKNDADFTRQAKLHEWSRSGIPEDPYIMRI